SPPVIFSGLLRSSVRHRDVGHPADRSPSDEAGAPMYARERQRQILDGLSRSGRVTVTDLAAHFEVTTETIRRDLDQLADRDLLVRVHGGAVPRRTAQTTAALRPRDPHSAVLLDAGTATAELLPHLSGRRGPVITNAPAIAQGALVHTDLAVHVLPGRVRPTTEAAVGSATVEAL